APVRASGTGVQDSREEVEVTRAKGRQPAEPKAAPQSERDHRPPGGGRLPSRVLEPDRFVEIEEVERRLLDLEPADLRRRRGQLADLLGVAEDLREDGQLLVDRLVADPVPLAASLEGFELTGADLVEA